MNTQYRNIHRCGIVFSSIYSMRFDIEVVDGTCTMLKCYFAATLLTMSTAAIVVSAAAIVIALTLYSIQPSTQNEALACIIKCSANWRTFRSLFPRNVCFSILGWSMKGLWTSFNELRYSLHSGDLIRKFEFTLEPTKYAFFVQTSLLFIR